MDWILGEVLENLKMQLRVTDSLINEFKEEQKMYKDTLSTDDKFEVARYNYWRGRVVGLEMQKRGIKETINYIYDMIDEESATNDEYEEELRSLREGF